MDARSQVPLFPISKRQTGMKYYEHGVSVTAAVGQAGTYFFSANGAYDPNVTGVGHQPMGFDQMMLMYEQYCVIKSRISVTFITGGASARVAIYVSPDAVALTNPQQLVENGLLVTQVIDGNAASAGTGNRICTLTASVDCTKYFGRGPNPRDMINDSALNGTAASNPTEQVYFGVAVWNYYTGEANTCYFDALVEYDLVFNEPRKLTVS